jgi:hypothetical protein
LYGAEQVIEQAKNDQGWDIPQESNGKYQKENNGQHPYNTSN